MSRIGLRRWRLIAGGTAVAGLLATSLFLAATDFAANRHARDGRALVAANQTSPAAPPTSTPDDLQPRVADAVPTGKRAATAVFRDVSPTDLPLRTGDVADVVAIFRKEQVSEETGISIDEDTVALIRGLTVLAVSDTGQSAAPAADRPSVAFRLRSFTVAASPEEAQLIALARQVGELRIGRCSTAACDDRNLIAP